MLARGTSPSELPLVMPSVCAGADLSLVPAGTWRCSPLRVICRNSVFGFHHFKNMKSCGSCPSHTCSSSLNFVPHFCFSSVNVTDCSLLLFSAAKWVCSRSWAQWVALQVLKCLQRKKIISHYWGLGEMQTMNFCYAISVPQCLQGL